MARHEPLKVPSTPCSEEEVRQHLEAFIEAFVVSHQREHWRQLLLETKKNDRLIRELRNGFSLDARFCRMLTNKEIFNQPIENHVGEGSGIFFSPDRSEPMRVTPADAIEKAWTDVADGLFSIKPGRLVVVFNHEQQLWLCQR